MEKNFIEKPMSKEDERIAREKLTGYSRREVEANDDPDGIRIEVVIPTPKKKNSGFTLIELAVTMFILGFVLLAMGTHIGVVMKTTVKDKQISAASHLLQDKMEGIKNTSYANVVNGSDQSSAIGATFDRNWTVTPVSNNMQQVQVVVSWTGGTVSGSTVISQ